MAPPRQRTTAIVDDSANVIKSYRDSLYRVDLVDGPPSLDLRLEILVSPGGALLSHLRAEVPNWEILSVYLLSKVRLRHQTPSRNDLEEIPIVDVLTSSYLHSSYHAAEPHSGLSHCAPVTPAGRSTQLGNTLRLSAFQGSPQAPNSKQE
jgi:hypothetical protein